MSRDSSLYIFDPKAPSLDEQRRLDRRHVAAVAAVIGLAMAICFLGAYALGKLG